MKIPNEKELKQTAFNHLSDINFKEFVNLYVKYTAKSFFFLVIDTALVSDNSSCFRNNFLQRT